MTVSKYDFKAVSRAIPAPHLTELSIEQGGRRSFYENMLKGAFASRVPKPTLSNYYVRTSVGIHGGKILPAGNIEYRCSSLHGEECAGAVYRAHYGDADPHHPLIGFQGAAGEISASCGNCRDHMLDTFGESLEIVTGHPDGGIATVMSLREMLFENYTPIAIDDSIHLATEETLDQALRLENDVFLPRDKYPRTRYYVLLATEGGNFYAGARFGVCHYHHVYSILRAVLAADGKLDPFVTQAWIVCLQRDQSLLYLPPDVMYKDRQYLLDLLIEAELVSGDPSWDAEVTLITCDGAAYDRGEVRVTGAWTTTAREWLPFPFTLYAFGEEFVAEAREKYRARLNMK